LGKMLTWMSLDSSVPATAGCFTIID